MKTNVKFNAIRLACAAALGVSAMSSGVSHAASATSNADAVIITPIAISNTAPLDFGTFAVGGALGTVVIAATGGARSATGGVVLPSGSAAGGAASFTVTGQAAATYTVTLPGAAATLTHTNTVNTMTVNTWTSNPGTAAGAGTLTGGTETLAVGGTLNVAASQLAGTYQGTFSVSVEYN